MPAAEQYVLAAEADTPAAVVRNLLHTAVVVANTLAVAPEAIRSAR
jgi:hypothetical protein